MAQSILNENREPVNLGDSAYSFNSNNNPLYKSHQQIEKVSMSPMRLQETFTPNQLNDARGRTISD